MADTQNRELEHFALMIVSGVVVVAAGIALAERGFVHASEAVQERRGVARAGALAEEGTLYVVPQTVLPVDPFAQAWEPIPGMDIEVTPQAVTMPALREASVEQVRVQAMTDGRVVAWRLSWQDEEPDWSVDTGRFTDAVALQFPLAADASYMMGEQGRRVQILHWKALWQKDVDEHFQDVQDLHPDFWSDLYWFAEGGLPYPVPDAFADPRSHQWFPALRAGNPMSTFDRTEPVEELVAEGYGSLTHQSRSVSRARGAWSDGRWAVVVARPLATDDPSDFQFAIGARGSFAVAVWEGGAGNVGGRKHMSNWCDFLVGAPTVVP